MMATNSFIVTPRGLIRIKSHCGAHPICRICHKEILVDDEVVSMKVSQRTARYNKYIHVGCFEELYGEFHLLKFVNPFPRNSKC